MRHNYLDNTPMEKARSEYLSFLSASEYTYKTEKIPSQSASGRVLAEAVYASICSPHYNASAMDGIAVKAKDTYGASESRPVILAAEQYEVVDTGDPVPDGYDSVVMVEDVTELGDGRVSILSAHHPWQNIRQVGEDICMGDMIAPSFTEITPSLCGAFLAGGVLEVKVIKKPVVGIIPTGDEIVSPVAAPGKGEIIEFNSAIFSSMLRQWGAEAKTYDIVKDKKELLRAALEKAVNECDAVLVLAGSSAGRDDYTSSVIASIGQVVFHGIAVKPGKPAVLGAVGNVPVVGLPGYPVSAIVIMDEIVKATVSLWYREKGKKEATVRAVLGKRVVSSLKYQEYIRVSLGKVGDTLAAVPLGRGAGVITSFTKADGILVVPQNSEGYEAGQQVEIKLLKDLSQIENSLIVTGSHDPLIDELSDMLKRKDSSSYITSSHVGSMGAISALKNSQAHLGCIHLLDTETGEYNESYVKKYFPEGGVRLVKGVGRVQGLMVKKGNPLGIKAFADIVKGRYVNRQIGSGTRILCDYLLNKNGIDKAEVDGYRNEEFTHTAVAAIIAAGNADCGLGIYSAAKMYDLDFIEICVEEYDVLISEKAYGTSQVQAFLDVMKSGEFKERLMQMGGYTLG
ncbi:MAG: molybdopterin biosynthesis protein [Ruminococcaceae bacterium]|nr:molybdopterin biosynthesis protein [Oscillospiraceae bacterium]